jgi:hypothetical protein
MLLIAGSADFYLVNMLSAMNSWCSSIDSTYYSVLPKLNKLLLLRSFEETVLLNGSTE